MTRRGRTEQAILGCLSLGPMTGYDIKGFVSQSIGNFWSESFGQIYPALHRMHDEGWIEPLQEQAQGSGRAKRRYQLTPRGRDILAEWLSDEPAPAPRRNELLLKVFFGANGSTSALASHIERRAQRAQEDLERYAEIRQRLSSSARKQSRFWRLTLRFGELERQAHLAWCEEALDELRALNTNDQQSSQETAS